MRSADRRWKGGEFVGYYLYSPLLNCTVQQVDPMFISSVGQVTLNLMFWAPLLHWEHLNQDNMEIGLTCYRTSRNLGPLMHGLLETPGITVTGHLEHGLLKIAPFIEGESDRYSM